MFEKVNILSLEVSSVVGCFADTLGRFSICKNHVFSVRLFTWIHGILWTNLVCRQVITARKITCFLCVYSPVFVHEFTGFCELFCLDTCLPHVKSRSFRKCIHHFSVREFTGFCEQMWCFYTCFPHVKLWVYVCKIMFSARVFTCFPTVNSPDSPKKNI